MIYKQIYLCNIKNIFLRRTVIVVIIVPSLIVGLINLLWVEGGSFCKEIFGGIKDIWYEYEENKS